MIKTLTTIVVLGVALLGCASSPAEPVVERDFVAMTTTGDAVTGESILGQVTIIDFWAVF